MRELIETYWLYFLIGHARALVPFRLLRRFFALCSQRAFALSMLRVSAGLHIGTTYAYHYM